jgi:hypothetical protein
MMYRARALANAGLVLSLTASFAQAQDFSHLKCHSTKDPSSFNLPATKADFTALQSAFSAKGCTLGKAEYFCVPSTKDNVSPPPSGPDIAGQVLGDDYICYKAKCPKEVLPAHQGVADQFGSRTQTGFKTELVCVPAVKEPPCSPPVSRIINTGKSGLGPDPTWQLVAAPAAVTTPVPAQAINQDAAWAGTLPSSLWISSGSGNQPDGEYVYRTCWYLCDAEGDLSLTGVLNDDQATFFLNGTQFGPTLPNNTTPPGTSVSLPTGDPLFKVPGENCLDIHVSNIISVNHPTGLDVTGFMTAQ